MTLGSRGGHFPIPANRQEGGLRCRTIFSLVLRNLKRMTNNLSRIRTLHDKLFYPYSPAVGVTI
jgi:hypothetical protein